MADMGAFSRIKEWCLDLVFPRSCCGCGAIGTLLCSACRPRLAAKAPSCLVCSRRNFTGILCSWCEGTSGLRRFLAPFSYRDPLVRELIHTYKYAGVQELSALFAEEIAAFLRFYAIRPAGPSVLVPIPLHRARERERGFNQAALLAAEIGARLDLAVEPALRRRRATGPQVALASFPERRANMAGAFAVTDEAAVAGRTAILVDDVSTSGATLSEAARVLRAAGARTVWALAIAKG